MSEQPDPPAASASVTRLIPDLDDELIAALWRIEELLLTLAAWADNDPDDVVELPAPLAGRAALDALHRLQDEVTPTQSRSHPSAAELPRLFGPDGHYEHRPLRLVEVAPRDLAVLTGGGIRSRSNPAASSRTPSRPAPKPRTRPPTQPQRPAPNSSRPLPGSPACSTWRPRPTPRT